MTNEKNNQGKAEEQELPVRKIQRTGRAGASYMVTLPAEIMDKLGWRERQKVTLEERDGEIIIKDWEE